MIYVTGDQHGNYSSLLKFSKSSEGQILTKNDYVIVLGDFGLFPETIPKIKRLDRQLTFTLLFLEGNHENHPLLDSFPHRTMFNGVVHDVFGIYHLCRGNIFNIPVDKRNITIAVCGGGDSRDKSRRVEGVDWFPEETITRLDVQNILEKAKSSRIDYFLSHSLSAAVKTEWYYECQTCSLNKKTMTSFEITESDYKIRDIIGKLQSTIKIYFSAHEHVDREFVLDHKRYRSVFKDFIKIE